MTKNMGELEELNEKQLFFTFAIMVSLGVNWVIGCILTIFCVPYWAVYVGQSILSLVLLLLVKRIKQ